jgi:hypothetical protein
MLKPPPPTDTYRYDTSQCFLHVTKINGTFTDVDWQQQVFWQTFLSNIHMKISSWLLDAILVKRRSDSVSCIKSRCNGWHRGVPNELKPNAKLLNDSEQQQNVMRYDLHGKLSKTEHLHGNVRDTSYDYTVNELQR